MVKRILLGIGGTPFTPVAIKRAVELAQRHAACLKAVTVVNPDKICKLGPVPPGAGFFARKMCENRLEITRSQVEESIASLEARCAESKVRLSVERETGKPFELIIAHARYHDLTIFGLRSIFEYHLANEPEKDLLRLLSSGVRPIIAISDTYRTINKVLLAYNGSVESASAMQHFVRLRLWPGAALDIVNIEDNPVSEPNLLEDAAAYCADHGYEVNTHLRAGKAIDQLLPFAREIDADMIVMGRSTRSMLVRHVLGDTVLNTLAHTHIPLFLSQ